MRARDRPWPNGRHKSRTARRAGTVQCAPHHARLLLVGRVHGKYRGFSAAGIMPSHTTKYVNDDPQYPCTMVADIYKKACYGFQPARMMQLFAGDFGRIGATCADIPDGFKTPVLKAWGGKRAGHLRGRAHSDDSVVSPSPKREAPDAMLDRGREK